jgi:hypothetical protein
MILGDDKSNAQGKRDAAHNSPSRGRVIEVKDMVGHEKSLDLELAGRARAEAEAEAFARLTAGARDPRAEAKRRLVQKVC